MLHTLFVCILHLNTEKEHPDCWEGSGPGGGRHGMRLVPAPPREMRAGRGQASQFPLSVPSLLMGTVGGAVLT